MRKFFTADLHLQSTEAPGIIEWAHRPFKSVEKHDVALMRGIRERVKPEDVLIHVGDFMNYGKNRGREAGRYKAADYMNLIDRNIIFLEGNHDPNNRVRTIGRTLTTSIGPYVVSVGHYPSCDSRFEYVDTPTYKCESLGMKWHIHLCGHVHHNWTILRDGLHKPNVLNINVGVDAWKYRPVSEAELVDFITKTLRG